MCSSMGKMRHHKEQADPATGHDAAIKFIRKLVENNGESEVSLDSFKTALNVSSKRVQ